MHPLEVRYKAVVHYTHFLHSIRRVAAIYKVSKSSLQKWIKASPSVRKHRSKKQQAAKVTQTISQAIATNPFKVITCEQLAHILSSECNIKVSRVTAGRYIRRLNFSKKKAFRVSDKAHLPDDIMNFCNKYRAANDKIVCIDEAAFYIGEQGKSGYAPKGQRLNISSSNILRRSKLTLLLAIATTGIVGFKILQTNCKTQDFVSFINELQVSPGSSLLMDNVAFHKSASTLEAIRRKHCRPLFIPAYSPKMNALRTSSYFLLIKHRYRTKCPVFSSATFDYTNLLIDVLSTRETFHQFFRRVDTFVRQAMDGFYRW